MVINKPYGIPSQLGSKQSNSIASMFTDYHLVHRLDKDVTGALLLAKTKESAAHIS